MHVNFFFRFAVITRHHMQVSRQTCDKRIYNSNKQTQKLNFTLSTMNLNHDSLIYSLTYWLQFFNLLDISHWLRLLFQFQHLSLLQLFRKNHQKFLISVGLGLFHHFLFITKIFLLINVFKPNNTFHFL